MASVSKKRKRGADDHDKTTFHLSSLPEPSLGPVLASFPALQPPKTTPFKCWKYTHTATLSVSFASQDMVIAGETDAVEFSTAGEGQSSAGCSYYVGIYDKRTNTTVIRPAPLHILAREVKALKDLPPIEVTTDERAQLRNKLGETFGTKKAKAAIRAQERNRVDIDAMRGVAGHIQETIMENTGSLPTLQEAKASADSNRLIPPHNASARKPQEAYVLSDIIPDSELNAISLSAFKSASSNRERTALLPFTHSNWINQHIGLLFSAPSLRKTEMKIIFYISAMFAFKMTSRSVNNKEAVQKRLSSVPMTIVDGLLSRFTETTREANNVQVTSQKETMLLTYLLTLCLMVDDYATDVDLIAKDLGMPPSKVGMLFKTLGCKIEKLDQKELKRLGLPDSAGETKRAVLKVPLQFPQPRPKRGRR